MINYSQYKPVQCKFGINCKFAQSCRFYHPQRQIYQYNYGYQQTLSPNVENLTHQFNSMNLQSQSLQQPIIQNQPVINDAQYQQLIYQPPVQGNLNQQNFVNYYPNQYQQIYNQNQFNFQKTAQSKQQVKKYRKSNKNYQSSDSNSDMQSDQEDQKDQHKSNKDQTNKQKEVLYSQDKIKKFNKKSYHQQHAKKAVDYQSYYLYGQALFPFFEKRRIKQHKRQAILKFLAKQIKFEPAVVQNIIMMTQYLEYQGFITHFCYTKLVKTICKQNFQLEAIQAKLMKKINLDMKRKTKDVQLQEKFPNPVDVEFLQSKDLLQNEELTNDTIYLIDGNNCLTTQKHLRHFFQQKDEASKAQAQIRFRWLISQVLKDSNRCYIFFDDKFSTKIYNDIMYKLMSQQEQKQMLKRTTVIYAQNDNEADEQIRKKMRQLVQKMPQQRLKNIMLITADRVLVQECYSIHQLRKSSGMYLIKFFKKYLKKQAKSNFSLKKIVKRILNYRD